MSGWWLAYLVLGAFVGFFSGLLGIGGGSVMVPVTGTLGYVLSGLSAPDLPTSSIGYIYLPAAAGIVVTSIIMAPVGAKLSHKTPARTLRKIFAVLLYVLATQMLLNFF